MKTGVYKVSFSPPGRGVGIFQAVGREEDFYEVHLSFFEVHLSLFEVDLSLFEVDLSFFDFI